MAMDRRPREVLTVARSVLEQLDVEVVLQRILRAAQELTGARFAALGVLDESRTGLDRFLTLGLDDAARRRIGSLPTGRGVLGELIRVQQPLRVGDIGRHPASYGFPSGHPPMRSFLGVPITVGDEPWGNLYLTEKRDGGVFDEDDERWVVLLAGFAGLAVDHARRFSASEDQRRGLQQTVTALDATMQISRALGGETELSAILELVATRGRALVGARALVIELLDGDRLELAAGAGQLPDDLLGRRVALAGTVASAALSTGRSRRLSDPDSRTRFEQHGLGTLGLDAQDGLVVPLVFRGRGYGVLVAVDREDGDAFTLEHQQLLESFAASAATAVATAQSVADERLRQRQAAAEDERSRWARELHDETLQALGGLRLLLAGSLRGDEAGKDAAIGQALTQLESDIASLRALITELRPAALDQLGLEPALLALIDRVRLGGLDVDVQIDLDGAPGRMPQRLAGELETGIYRIVQEALTNAVKHGGAERAVVEVTEVGGQVTVAVRDDGAGFDPTTATTGFGLVGMRERAELLDGTIDTDSVPGRGTTIQVTLPVSRRPQPRPVPNGGTDVANPA
jgi:signal transduction histidine kinase